MQLQRKTHGKLCTYIHIPSNLSGRWSPVLQSFGSAAIFGVTLVCKNRKNFSPQTNPIIWYSNHKCNHFVTFPSLEILLKLYVAMLTDNFPSFVTGLKFSLINIV